MPSRLTHVPAFDGLRPRPVGGFLGVDIFFVLSGFLIAGLLLQEWQARGAVDLKAFYARRALRLLPALFAVMSVVLLFPGVFWARHRPWADAIVISFYATNWVRAFELDRSMDFFGHTWSLAIEGQFYLLWPPLLLLLLRRRLRRSWIIALVILGIGASVGLHVWLWDGPASVKRLYYGLDTRADSILIGCLLGLVFSWSLLPASRMVSRMLRLSAAVSALALVALIFTLRGDSHSAHHGLSTVACISVGVLLLHVLHSPSALARAVLENRVLAGIGRISYGLYLWHHPIFFDMLNPTRMSTFGISGSMLVLVRFAVAFAAAIVSFWLIERPFLRLKTRFGRRREVEYEGPGAPAGSPGPRAVGGR